MGDVYQGQLVRYRVSALKASWLVPVWLEHLALSAAGLLSGPTRLFTLEKDQLQQYQLAVLPVTAARAELQRWWQAFTEGLQAPLCLPLNTAWTWLEKTDAADEGDWACGPDDMQQKARAKAENVYLGDGSYQIGEVADIYLARVFPTLDDDAWDKLEAAARSLLVPLYNHCEEIQA